MPAHVIFNDDDDDDLKVILASSFFRALLQCEVLCQTVTQWGLGN